MTQQITKGIKISVKTRFEGALYKDHNMRYAFAYTITIANHGKSPVKLQSRYWDIYDAQNQRETVAGMGVVGQQPILLPNEKHTYTSGCLLLSPFGAMAGHYNMVNLSTQHRFKVTIPTFYLNAPFALN